jgi:undecaprenyl-diphosphatase
VGIIAAARRRLASWGRTAVRLAGGDVKMLCGVLLAVAGAWAFVLIAGAVSEGSTQKLDERIMRGLRDAADISVPRGPAWLPEAMRDVTALGSSAVLVIFTLTVACALVVRRQLHALLLLLASTVGGVVLIVDLKAFFSRPRPDLALRLTEVGSTSFPSGHATESAVIYLTLAVLLSRMVAARALKLYFVAVALAFSFLVGLSRVYLGVHYPSDVLAGWTVGLAWAVLCWWVASYLQGRGTVEPPK